MLQNEQDQPSECSEDEVGAVKGVLPCFRMGRSAAWADSHKAKK
jgi:hypothetical protein